MARKTISQRLFVVLEGQLVRIVMGTLIWIVVILLAAVYIVGWIGDLYLGKDK